MQGIFEMIFDIVYLGTAIILGYLMIKKSKKESISRIFGIMAILLGLGDAFHLIPRVYGLLINGLSANVVALGFGKLITSISMTIFYLLLFYVWRKRYKFKGSRITTVAVISLSFIRIVLCFLPQNGWFILNPSLAWGIYRNIPFLIIGIILIVLFYKKSLEFKEDPLSKIWLAIVLSFAFYLPVVLCSKAFPLVGILMIPKTIAYVWILIMGYKTLDEEPMNYL